MRGRKPTEGRIQPGVSWYDLGQGPADKPMARRYHHKEPLSIANLELSPWVVSSPYFGELHDNGLLHGEAYDPCARSIPQNERGSNFADQSRRDWDRDCGFRFGLAAMDGALSDGVAESHDPCRRGTCVTITTCKVVKGTNLQVR